MVIYVNTLIVGASISGLACAACLHKNGIAYSIIEKENQIAAPWHHHYERLHLHTSKHLSNLPFKKFDESIPRYPSRLEVLDYLKNYQTSFNIQPLFNTQAMLIKKEADVWMTETNNGTFKSKYLIIATGAFSKPKQIAFKGIEDFAGKILHSYEYKSGKEFSNKKVLVVGFGNSACEIAIDLYEQGAMPCMSVRSPVNVVPREIAHIPVQQISLWMNFLPAAVADKLNAPIINLSIGNITKLGLQKQSYGPLKQIEKDGNAPVLDIGTIKHIRKGHIKIYKGIHHIKSKTVYFNDDVKDNFDVIIAAIGYERNNDIIQVDKYRFDDLKFSTAKQKYFGKDGLYFCGFYISPTGQIREIAIDAKRIAQDIAQKEKISAS